jgi:hypothetical protein
MKILAQRNNIFQKVPLKHQGRAGGLVPVVECQSAWLASMKLQVQTPILPKQTNKQRKKSPWNISYNI